MASFPSKIGWKRLTKRGNKNYRSVSFLPKASLKIQKIKEIPLWHHFKPKQVGKGSERENKNNRFVSFRSDPTRKRKFKIKQQKNSIN